MKKLTRDNRSDLKHVDDRRTKTVKVKEWGFEIDLCSMSAKDREQFEIKYNKLQKHEHFIESFALMCVYCIVDENRERIYKDEDVKELLEKDSEVITNLFMECTKLNKMTQDDVEEEAKK